MTQDLRSYLSCSKNVYIKYMTLSMTEKRAKLLGAGDFDFLHDPHFIIEKIFSEIMKRELQNF